MRVNEIMTAAICGAYKVRVWTESSGPLMGPDERVMTVLAALHSGVAPKWIAHALEAVPSLNAYESPTSPVMGWWSIPNGRNR